MVLWMQNSNYSLNINVVNWFYVDANFKGFIICQELTQNKQWMF